jgi:hypothetical protein
MRPAALTAAVITVKSRRAVCARALGLVIAGVLASAALPVPAWAHGVTAPNATSYLATVSRVPAGVRAIVVDGDLRLWLRVRPSETVVVRDYRGAPYLRFSRSGVAVNENSAMFYLNFNPPLRPPKNLGATTPPKWRTVSGGHEYSWHDGRLGAFSTVALPPSADTGPRYLGRWIVPLLLDGRPSVVSGGVWHAANPSIVWFWPIIVLVACVLAAWRLHRSALDARVARLLACGTLVAIGVGAYGRQLHGRPTVSVGQIALLVLVLVVVTGALAWTLLGRAGYFTYLLISIAALGGDFELIPTLLHGYVLMAEPAFVARAAAVVCAGCGAGLLVLAIRLGDEPESALPAGAPAG